jgi:hypothetical protein
VESITMSPKQSSSRTDVIRGWRYGLESALPTELRARPQQSADRLGSLAPRSPNSRRQWGRGRLTLCTEERPQAGRGQ